MTERGTIVTHDVPDAGTWYAEGATVHVDRVASGVHIVADPNGDYEVLGCQHAGTRPDGRSLLQVQLRKLR